ncbi:MAG TPA: hypothetical protein VFH21_04790 [Burkholderiales bacterium]|nr:hypothetical protein [Burkholderiales bacterium]
MKQRHVGLEIVGKDHLATAIAATPRVPAQATIHEGKGHRGCDVAKEVDSIQIQGRKRAQIAAKSCASMKAPILRGSNTHPCQSIAAADK